MTENQKDAWDESYQRGDNFVFYPHEEAAMSETLWKVRDTSSKFTRAKLKNIGSQIKWLHLWSI